MKSESQNTLPTSADSGKDSPSDMSDAACPDAIALPDGPSIDTLSIAPDSMMANDYRNFALPKAPTVIPGAVGLHNIGNTCFMNSTLQCLLHCRPLWEHFLSGKYKEEINETNPLGTGGKLAKEFAKLVDMFWNEPTESVVTPRELKWVIAQHAPMFGGYQQQDSQELVTFLLDGLHEDLNLVKEKSYTEVIEANDRPDEVVANLCWEQHLLRNKSKIVDLFQGQYKSRLRCPHCEKSSVTFDPFMYLSLPIPSVPDMSILVTMTYAKSDSSLPPIRFSVNVFRDSADLTQAIQAAVLTELPEEYSDSMIAEEILVFSQSSTYSCFQLMDGSNFYATSSLATKRKVFCTFAPRLTSVSSEAKRYRNTGISICVQLRICSPTGSSFFTPVGCPTALVVSKEVSGEHFYEELMKAIRHQIGSRCSNLINALKSGKATVRLIQDNATVAQCLLSSSAFEANSWSNFSSERSNKSFLNLIVDVPFAQDESGTACEDIVSMMQRKISDDYRTESSWRLGAVMDLGSGNSPSRQRVSIKDCFELFSKEEVLSAEDQWYCSTCKAHVQASKKIDLYSLPEILIIHLKRFQYARGFRNKIESVIDFPAKEGDFLELETLDRSIGNRYRLFAVSNHMGSLYSGHYTAYADGIGEIVDRNNNEKWFSFNDSCVSKMDSEPIPDSCAYLLFYQRSTAH